MPWLEAAVLMEESNCSVMLGREDKALDLLARAQHGAQAAGLRAQVMRARGLQIGVQTNSGDPWAAFAGAPSFLADYWEDGYPPSRVHQIAFNLSTASEYLGYPDAAYSFAEAGVNAISETTNRRTEAASRARLSAIALRAGRLDDARREAEIATKLLSAESGPSVDTYRLDSVLSAAEAALATRDFTALRSVLQNPETAKPMPTFLLDLKLGRARAELACHDRDWQRASIALDGVFEDLHRRLKTADSTRRPALFRQAAQLYRLRAQLLLDEGRPEQALEAALELSSWAQSTVASKELHPSSGETWIVYVAFRDRVGSWILDASGERFRWVPGTRQELARRIAQFGVLASSPESTEHDLAAVGRDLFRDLIDLGTAALCESCRLVIVPDEEIAALPFAALPSPDGTFLGLRVPVIRAHSLPPANPAAGIEGVGLLVSAGKAVNRPGLRLPSLPEVEVESDFIASNMNSVKLLSGDAVTLAAISTLAPSASWFHFAGHGFSNGGNGALFLSNPESPPITSDQIVRMKWTSCKLAVLSACWAGAGEQRALTHPSSLVQAFLSAGVTGVIAPVWSIDSLATADWMKSFYSAVRQPTDPASAIRTASRDLSRRPAFRHPYYWASFAYFT